MCEIKTKIFIFAFLANGVLDDRLTMETILEQQRRLHEERERLVKAMVDELVVRSNTVSDFEVIRPERLQLFTNLFSLYPHRKRTMSCRTTN